MDDLMGIGLKEYSQRYYESAKGCQNGDKASAPGQMPSQKEA